MNVTLLQNSLLLAAGSTLVALAVGILCALAALGLGPKARGGLLAVAILGLALPQFLVTAAWLHYFGMAGVWRSWLPWDLYGLPGAVAMLALTLWPIPFLMVLGAWTRLDRSLVEAEPGLARLALLWDFLIPAARPAIGVAALLLVALGLCQFTIPALLQVKVLPVEIWIDFNTRFDAGSALARSWPLLLGPLLILAVVRRRGWSWPARGGEIRHAEWRRRLGGTWAWLWMPGACLVVGLVPGLPLFHLAVDGRTWRELPSALAAGWGAIGHSFLLASLTAGAVVFLAVATRRIRLFGLDWMAFLLPGVLLGIGMILVFNRPGLAPVLQSAAIVVLAWSFRYLGPGRAAVLAALRGVDREVVEAARLDGARGWQLFRVACWPQAGPQLGAAALLVYVLCLWDVETLLLVVPPGAETLALRIFNFLHYGHNAQVNALCLVLLLLALLPGAAWLAIRRFPGFSPRPVARSGRAFLGAALVAGAGLLATGCSKSDPLQTRLESPLFSHVRIIGTRGAGLGQFNKPRSVAVDREDNLYVVDMTGRVQKFSPEGEFLSYWQMEQTDKGKPKGMCLDEAGQVVVVEPHYSRVNHFTPAGRLSAQWGAQGTNSGQLAFPRAVAVTPRGDAYVSEYGITERVQLFSAGDRRWIRTIGRAGTGPGEFNRPEGLGLDAAGRLYVADSCNHRIQVFAPDGQPLRSHGRAGSGKGEFSYPYDVRVDATGRRFVCEFGNSRVQVFDAEDRVLEILGGTGSAPGRFHNPWSLALDSQGNLYVADSVNHRVQKFVRRPGTHPTVARSTDRSNDRLAGAGGGAVAVRPETP